MAEPRSRTIPERRRPHERAVPEGSRTEPAFPPAEPPLRPGTGTAKVARGFRVVPLTPRVEHGVPATGERVAIPTLRGGDGGTSVPGPSNGALDVDRVPRAPVPDVFGDSRERVAP